MSIGAVVLGATGYVGGELLRLLANHPQFELRSAVSSSRFDKPVAATFPHLVSVYGDTEFSAPGTWAEKFESGDRVALFSAAPHGTSAAIVAESIETAARHNLQLHIVDVSADFRYATPDEFTSVYGLPHPAPQLLGHFSCALPEHLPNAETAHVAHPGCFATAILLGAMPLVSSGIVTDELFVTGVTGSTGSGRVPQTGTHHPERHGNLYAYKPLAHRHAPEVRNLLRNQSQRDIKVNFVPHSGPFARGIHATIQARLAEACDTAELLEMIRTFYARDPFVQVVGGTPRLKNVVASNYCHVGAAVAGDQVVVMTAIDNLVKGAAGGAIQWMNRLWSLPETEGLGNPAPAWT